MKKAAMLIALILGTSAMVNANTTPMKKETSKEVTTKKHKRHGKAKEAKEAKVVAPTPSTTKK